MGVKLGPIAVLDEIGLIISSIIKIRYPIKIHVDIFTITLFYFILIYLAGFLISRNINTLRFIVIGLLLIGYGDLKASSLARKSILISAVFYLLLTMIIPLFGFHYGLDIAWWQQGIWTGTAYSSIGIFVSAILIVTLTNYNLYSFLAIISMYLIGILTDSRYTILLTCIVLLVYFLKIMSDNSLFNIMKRVAEFLVLIVLFTILVLDFLGFNYSDLYTIQQIQVKSVTSTVFSLVTDDGTRDQDRKDMNAAVFSLTSDSPLTALFGSGGLSHQKDMTTYVRASSDGRVRPVGFPAIVFDGGWIFFFLIFACSTKSLINIFLKYKTTPLFIKAAAMSFPFVAFLSVFITNTLDAVLFWIMISPVGLSSFFVECWHSQSFQA